MSNIQPTINVTPLIDVLLVLLIIFMVISPAKPTDFKTRIPQEPKRDEAVAHPDTLIVQLASDSSLRLNNEPKFGTVEEPEKMIERLSAIFRDRAANGTYVRDAGMKNDSGADGKIERTVFIKAPRSMGYGTVVKVIDAVKTAGAQPISLQIDDLN